MAESLGDAVLDLRTNQKQLDQGIDRAQKGAERLNQKFLAVEKTLKKLGAGLQAAGKKMTLFVTAPIVGLGALAVKLADVQIQAEAGLAAAISFTGIEVAKVLPDLKAFASELQRITTTGDETSLKMLQVATSMGLTADQSKVAVKEAIGLAKAFGISEVSAIRYTASLASGDTTMLNRYIPTLRQVTDDAERTAKAHEILAGAFSVAVAEAENGLGPWKQLGNEFGDLLEDLGAIILKGLEPLVGILKSAIQWVATMDDNTKRWIVTIAATAAAIGPVLIALGTLLTVLGSLAGMMASGGVIAVGATTLVGLLAGPLGIALALAAVVTAIGIFLREGGVFENWIAGTNISLQELVGNVKDLQAAYEAIKPDIAAVNQLSDEFRETNSELFRAIQNNVAQGKNYDAVVLSLLERFKEGTTEGDALRAKLEEVGSTTGQVAVETITLDTNMAAAKKTADGFKGTATELERAMWALANSAKANVFAFEDLSKVDVSWPKLLPPTSAPALVDTLARAQERWNISIPNTTKELASLNVLMKSGQVPAKQMAEIIARQIEEYDRLGVLTPEIEQKLRAMGKETGIATGNFDDFFGKIRTGIPAVDGFLGKLQGFLGIFKSITGALSGVSKGLGDFFGKIGGLFGGGKDDGGGGGGIGDLLGGLFGGGGGGGGSSDFFGDAATESFKAMGDVGTEGGLGFLGGLQGIMSKLGSFAPIIGPLLSIFGPTIFKGLKAIGGKILSVFKGIFGGPNAAELGGRKVAAAFKDTIALMLDDAQRAEVAQAVAGGASEAWAQKVIGLRDSMLALGRTEAEALAFSDQLWQAEKQGPEAVQRVIDSIQPSLDQVSAAMARTGLSLTELRNRAINDSKKLGISVAEAFQRIAAGTTEMVGSSAAAARQSFRKAQRDMLRDAGVSREERKKQMDTLRAKNKSTQDAMVLASKNAQMAMANASISAAQISEDAWVKSATNTAKAWRKTKQDTVGDSSIIDIADMGSASADRLRKKQEEAARATEEAWRRASRQITGTRSSRRDVAFDDAPVSRSESVSGRRERRGGGDSGDLVIQLEVDGERMARKVVKRTPEILRKMGLT